MSTRRRKSRRRKLPALQPSQMEQDMGTPLYRAWFRLVRAAQTIDRLEKKHCRNEQERGMLAVASLNAMLVAGVWASVHFQKSRERQAAKEVAA